MSLHAQTSLKLIAYLFSFLFIVFTQAILQKLAATAEFYLYFCLHQTAGRLLSWNVMGCLHVVSEQEIFDSLIW